MFMASGWEHLSTQWLWEETQDHEVMSSNTSARYSWKMYYWLKWPKMILPSWFCVRETNQDNLTCWNVDWKRHISALGDLNGHDETVWIGRVVEEQNTTYKIDNKCYIERMCVEEFGRQGLHFETVTVKLRTDILYPRVLKISLAPSSVFSTRELKLWKYSY